MHRRQAGAAPLPKRLDAPERHQQTQTATGQGKQHAFREQLAGNPPASGSERGADGHLPLPRGRAREQEVGDVRAGDEQDKRDRAQQHEQRSLHIADDLLVQADQRQDTIAAAAASPLAALAALAARPGIAARSRGRSSWLNALRNCLQLGLRLLKRHAGFQSSNGFQKHHAFTIAHEGSPRFTKRQRSPKLKRFGILKARRKNAHDGVTLFVQRDRPAQHVRVAAKSALPEAVSENGRLGAVGRVLFPGEVASQRRLDAEQWKEIRRHCAGHDSFRRSGPCEGHVAATVGGDARQRLALGFDFNERGAANDGAGACPTSLRATAPVGRVRDRAAA